MSRTIARRSRVARLLRRRRKRRKGEHVCECEAYDFPHRFSGGACTGREIVKKQWGDNGGWNRDCLRCHSRDKSTSSCQVLEGAESVRECPAWQSFVDRNEIRVSLSRLRVLGRSAIQRHAGRG